MNLLVFLDVQDFAIQQLERRINRMMGEQSNEEKLQLEAQIKELLKELDEKNKTHNMLDKQINTLQVIYYQYFSF